MNPPAGGDVSPILLEVVMTRHHRHIHEPSCRWWRVTNTSGSSDDTSPPLFESAVCKFSNTVSKYWQPEIIVLEKWQCHWHSSAGSEPQPTAVSVMKIILFIYLLFQSYLASVQQQNFEYKLSRFVWRYTAEKVIISDFSSPVTISRPNTADKSTCAGASPLDHSVGAYSAPPNP